MADVAFGDGAAAVFGGEGADPGPLVAFLEGECGVLMGSCGVGCRVSGREGEGGAG